MATTLRPNESTNVQKLNLSKHFHHTWIMNLFDIKLSNLILIDGLMHSKNKPLQSYLQKGSFIKTCNYNQTIDSTERCTHISMPLFTVHTLLLQKILYLQIGCPISDRKIHVIPDWLHIPANLKTTRVRTFY